MSGLLLRPTIAPRKLHCRIAPFWPRSQPSSRRNDVRNGSIGICWMMELRCWGSLFGPPSSVRSPLSKWPRTPIPHLRYGNFTTLSDTSLHTLHNDIFKFYVQEIFQRDGCRFSDQSYKTVSCISGNGIPERYDAKMHTVLAYPNVKVYSILSKLLGVGEQDPFSSTLNVLCSSCFTR